MLDMTSELYPLGPNVMVGSENTGLADAEFTEDDMRLDARDLLEAYFVERVAAKEALKPEGDQLRAIQEDVRNYLAENGICTERQAYDVYDEQAVRAKIGGLLTFLRSSYADCIPLADITATELFIDSTFAMYNERPSNDYGSEPTDGTFAFVVPARMSRSDPEYGAEVEPVIPAFRYIPNEMRSQMMVGLPPFIIDRYEPDEDGKRGYLVFAPVFYKDLAQDYAQDQREVFRISRQNVNDAVDFAQQSLGVDVVGLGAALPRVTRFGRSISNKNVLTTTGHGGTVQLIKETVRAGMQKDLVDGGRPIEELTVGVLGLGSIGASIADVMADEFSETAQVVFDVSSEKTDQVSENLMKRYGQRIKTATSVAELIASCDIVVCAIDQTIDLDALGITDLKDKFIVDDSQPGAFDPQQVTARGGRMAWVIGRGGVARRTDYDYATMVDSQADIFGCEAEAAALSRYKRELRGRGMPQEMIDRLTGKVALRGPVTPQGARLIGALFKKYGVGAAPLQAFGELVEPR